MKKLLIIKEPSIRRWYSGYVGQLVPYLGDVGN